MHKEKLLTRAVSGAVVVAVTAGSALLVNGVAGAVPPPGTLGSITITPAEGDDNARMSAQTSRPCPSNAKLADLVIEGPVGSNGTAPDSATFPTSNSYPVTTLDPNQFSTTVPFVQQFNKTIKDAATERGKPIQAGEYHLTTRCWDESALEVLGTFTAGLNFDTPTHYTVIPTAPPSPTPVVTPSPTPTPVVTPSPTPTPVVTPPPGARMTVTTLSVPFRFQLPFGLGGFLIPFAHVDVQDSPAHPTGTVQFFLDGKSIGGPVRVDGRGDAQGGLALVSSGSHNLTAKFIPIPASLLPSTSNTVTVKF